MVQNPPAKNTSPTIARNSTGQQFSQTNFKSFIVSRINLVYVQQTYDLPAGRIRVLMISDGTAPQLVPHSLPVGL